jgi:hypothetical protein
MCAGGSKPSGLYFRELYASDMYSVVEVPIEDMTKACLGGDMDDLLMAVVPNKSTVFSSMKGGLEKVKYVVWMSDGVPRMSRGRIAVKDSSYYEAMLLAGREVDEEFEHEFCEGVKVTIVIFKHVTERFDWKVKVMGWCRTKVASSQKPLLVSDLKDYARVSEPCFTDIFGNLLACATMYKTKSKDLKVLFKSFFCKVDGVAHARLENAGGGGLQSMLDAVPACPGDLPSVIAQEKEFSAVVDARYKQKKEQDKGKRLRSKGLVGEECLVEDKAHKSSRKRVNKEEAGSGKAAVALEKGEVVDIVDDENGDDNFMPGKRHGKSPKVKGGMVPDEECVVKEDDGDVVRFKPLKAGKILEVVSSFPLEVVKRQYNKVVEMWDGIFRNEKKLGDAILAKNPANFMASLTWEEPGDLLAFVVIRLGKQPDMYELYLGLSELASDMYREVKKVLIGTRATVGEYVHEHWKALDQRLECFLDGVATILEETLPPWKFELNSEACHMDAKRAVYALAALQSGVLGAKIQMYRSLYRVAFLSKTQAGGRCSVEFPSREMDDATRVCVETFSKAQEHVHYWCNANAADTARFLHILDVHYQRVYKEFGDFELPAGKVKLFLGMLDETPDVNETL